MIIIGYQVGPLTVNNLVVYFEVSQEVVNVVNGIGFTLFEGKTRAALQAGDVDAVRDVPLSEVEKLQADPKLHVEMSMVTRTSYYGFNTGRDYFKDVRVR